MKHAEILWDNRQNPLSKTYNETYFSVSGGLEESNHVFLDGNNLPSAWKNKDNFTICECGFGTGLNFLATVKLMQECLNPPKQLTFISIENSPLRLDDFKKTHENYPLLKKYTQKLYDQYPPLAEGFHLIKYNENITLLLLYNDVIEALANLTCKVDVWFLDGFSPSINTAMWDDKVFRYISNLSKVGTTASTYTVARRAKDALTKCGFQIEKVKGYGTKKHMLKATCKKPKTFNNKPWFSIPNPSTCKEKKALVVGAGIAGSIIAYSLAKQGWKIDIVDKYERPGCGASGNHCGVVSPLITKPNINLGKMYQSAFLQSLQWYKKLIANEGAFCGIKHYAHNKIYMNRWEIWKQKKTPLFTCKEDEFGKYFFIKNGGYIQPYKICQKLLYHENISFYKNTNIKNIAYINQKWQALSEDNKQFIAPIIIIATGINTSTFLPNHSFALQNIRGQVTHLPHTLYNKTPLCDEGYICPFIEDKQVIGATYIRNDTCLHVRVQDNEKNLKNIQKFLSEDVSLKPKELSGRVSFRLSTNDRFPIIGALHDEEFYKKEYKSLPWTKHKPSTHSHAKYLPNAYISTAHGSRGLVSALLGANIISSMINGTPIPLEKELLDELHPARFAIRKIQKQESW